MQSIHNFREITRDIIWPPHPNYTEEEYPRLDGKVYLVTGASSGIGFETAKLLVSQGAKVYITGRTPAKITAALEALRELGQAEYLDIQNENLGTVRTGVVKLLKSETRLDGLVHNAGINYRGQNFVEPYNVLDIIVINVLAAQLIQQLLIDLLVKTPDSRVIWLTSAIHYHSPADGGIAWDDMNTYDSGGYLGKGNGMYGQTKAMNIYQAVQWGKRYPSVVSVAVHPGTIVSDIRRSNWWRNLVLGSLSQPTIWGAYQVCQLLIGPNVTTADNGNYYVPFGLSVAPREDVEAGAKGANGEKFWKWANTIIDQ